MAIVEVWQMLARLIERLLMTSNRLHNVARTVITKAVKCDSRQ